MKFSAKFCLFITFCSLNHRLIFAQQNQDNQKTLSPLNSTEQEDHHRNGLTSQSQSQQTTYSPTKAQFSNSGFVPIAKPLIAKLPERYDNTQNVGSNDQQQVDPGSVLTRMGYTNNQDYEVPGYGMTNFNFNQNYNPSAYYDQRSASLLQNMKQDQIGADSTQDTVQQGFDQNIRYGDRYSKFAQPTGTTPEDYSGEGQNSGDVSRQNFYKQLSGDTEVAKFLKSSASESNEELAGTEPTESSDSESEFPQNQQMGDNYQLNKGQKQSSFPMLNEEQQFISPEMAQQLFKAYGNAQELSGNSLTDNQISPNGGSSESDFQSILNQLSQNSIPSMQTNLNQKTQSDAFGGSEQYFSPEILKQLAASYGSGVQNNGQMNPQLSSQINSQLTSQLNSQLNSQFGSQFGSQFNPQINSQLSQQMAMSSQLTPQMTNNQGLPLPGLENFQPAPEGGQLPAPPGYKHVGYITIPAGTANVPSMIGANGLPIIRPMTPMMSAQTQDMSGRVPLGMTQKHLQSFHDQSKKNQEKQTSESKPRRTFLSRLNPLNMLRRLRQRRERRQTNDLTAHKSNPDILRMSTNGVYGMSPVMGNSGYGSMSGLGGMSGLSGMYASASGPQPFITGMPSGMSGFSGSMSPYSGGFSYGGIPSSGFNNFMTSMGGMNKDMTASASDGSSMPMMMPYNPMGSYSQMTPMAISGMGQMGSMGSMAQMPGMGQMPYAMIPQQSQSQSSQEESQSESNPNQLPGGLNLSDLLKDEEDEEPSRFRRFLSYLNPVNLFRRLRDRNNTDNDERKRFGRYRRSVDDIDERSFVHFPQSESNPVESRLFFLKRSGRKSRMRFPRNDDSDIASFNETDDKELEPSSDKLDSADSDLHPLSDHNSDESVGRPRNRYNHRRNQRQRQRTHFNENRFNLMGSGNFEVIRGGTFRPEETSTSPPQEDHDRALYDTESSGNVFNPIEDEYYESGSPEVLGFQGFNGFGSVYNSLSASNKIPTIDKRRDDSIGSIENPSLTTQELKATS